MRERVEMALGGDREAIKLILQYLVGKPVAAPNPDRVDHEEWELRPLGAAENARDVRRRRPRCANRL